MRCKLKIKRNNSAYHDDCSEDILEKDEVIGDIVQSEKVTLIINLSDVNSSDVKDEIYINISGEDYIAKRKRGSLKYEVQYGAIFLCIWGLCRIRIRIDKNDNTSETFFSGYMNVLLDRNQDRNENIGASILKMVEFVISNNTRILQANANKKHLNVKTSLEKFGINGARDVFEEMALLDEIVEGYSKNYREFSKNLKYKLDEKSSVESIDKLTKITQETVQYISTHINELEEVDYHTGIEYQDRHLQPRRVLTYQNEYDYNIYENQVIIGFLKMVIMEVEEKLDEFISGDYNRVNFAEITDIRDILDIYRAGYQERLSQILDDLENIYSKYRYLMKDFGIKDSFIGIRPTSIFLKNEHYREIYNLAESWIEKNSYNINKDEIMYSMTTIDRIYEYYSLFKVMEVLIKKLNYSLVESSLYKYEIETDREGNSIIDYEINEHIDNTFVFRDERENEIVLYYQPVVHSYKFENELGLYRIDGEKEYYTPDFILKVKNSELDKYIILDAKWQNKKTLMKKNGDVSKVAFKYGFLINGDEKSSLEEVFIFQGKDMIEEWENTVQVFQSSPLAISKNNLRKPLTTVIPLTPNYDESEYLENKLNELLK